MTTQNFYEIIGYAASLLIAVSLTMSSIVRLRIINLIGAVFFTVYGVLIQAYPVAVVNFFIILINVYYLYEFTNTKEYFKFLEMRPNANYLRYFLDFHHKEIHSFLPRFDFEPKDDQMIFFVLRNTVPAGLFIGKIEDGLLRVQLDYVIPGYRDLKVGSYLYQQKEFFNSMGVNKICSAPGSIKHERYLKRMGFSAVVDEAGKTVFELVL